MKLFQLHIVLTPWVENIPIRVNQTVRSGTYLKLHNIKCYGNIFLGHRLLYKYCQTFLLSIFLLFILFERSGILNRSEIVKKITESS